MKTLIFCTSFARARDTWNARYRRWVDAIRASALHVNQILIVDDGSPVLPNWPDVTVVHEGGTQQPEQLACSDPLVLYHFVDNLGRKEIYDFPGWYRSFSFGCRYAKSHGFDKVIHLESDAYLTSYRMQNYANILAGGWTALWCPKYNFPEIAVQIIAGQEIDDLAAFMSVPYSKYIRKNHELMLPFTYVEKNFVGDRYGESMRDIPREADYAAQVQQSREPDYYWWLYASKNSEGNESAGDDKSERAHSLDLEFGKDGESEKYVGAGWSYSEAQSRWMVGPSSEIMLPGAEVDRDYTLLVWLIPHIRGKLLPTQRLFVEMNGQQIAEFEMDSAAVLGIDLPVALINRDGGNRLRFIHPDAKAPAALGGSGDQRELAFNVRRIVIRPKTPTASPARTPA
jgi:hypothetical protein